MDNNVTLSADNIHGAGVGLRSSHYSYVIANHPPVPWFEILTDNYLIEGGSPLHNLMRIRQDYPMAMHSVGMSLGSTDPLNKDYLHKIKQLADLIQPSVISDHLCWTSIDNQCLHELLPLPYTEEAITHVVQRIKEVQDHLEQPILIENVSSYLTYKSSQINEWEFINTIAEQANCYILLDINNIFVSAQNHNFAPTDYLQGIAIDRVKQFHLAGYTDLQTHLLDTHSDKVHPPVWELYKTALKRFGPVPTLLEWDKEIPEFAALLQEMQSAQHFMDEITGAKHADAVA